MKLKIKNTKIGGVQLLIIVLTINLILISAVDIYIPALPQIRNEFNVSESYLNLTLFVFLAVSAFTVLLAAPISDKFGRRPTMVFSCIIFLLGSLVCALAPNVEIIFLGRIMQASGVGLVESVVTTIVKESFHEENLNFAMSLLQSLIIVGPFVAPFAGTAMLSLFNWRAIFILLVACSILCIFLVYFLPETKPDSIAHKKSRPLKLLLNRKFVALVAILGISGLPVYAFAGVFPYICFDHFQNGYLDYNLLYALTCIMSIAAPFVFQALAKKFSHKIIFIFCIVLLIISVVAIPFIGYLSCLMFIICYLPNELAEGIIRPMSFIILLDQPEEQVSTASSIGNFAYNIIVAFGSVIATLPIWPDYIFAIAGITTISTVIMTILLFIAKPK